MVAHRTLTPFAGVRIPQSPPFIKKLNIAGWSSLVARRAHNPKVVGSNPAPATKKDFRKYLRSFSFCKNLRYKKEIVHKISV